MNLLSSTYVFSFFTLLSRILGYLRDILIAIFLGASIFADAFFVAFRLPNTFRRLFAEGTFNAAFIPSYVSAKTKNQKKGKPTERRDRRHSSSFKVCEVEQGQKNKKSELS